MIEDIKIAFVVEVRVKVAHVDDGGHNLRVTQNFQGLVSYHPLVRKFPSIVGFVLVDDCGINVRSL